MKSGLNFIAIGLFLFAITACKTSKVNKDAVMAGYVSGNYEIECMGTGMDGTQLVKVWGFGTDPEKAAYQARKNAVHAVLFKGINAGKPGCMTRPLVTQPGAEELHREFFNTFFTDGGRYLSFVSMANDGTVDRIKMTSKEYKVGSVMSIRHAALRQELEAAGIIKKLGQGF
ncbi:MAG: hypothetical protein IPH94_18130 [Saprospiraceae bacterium]|nr:hypothetical protein [Saprospiraceae bacterium]MBK8851234.1 hypothetical protein [Saprospiraceae bacterium]MBK9689616.1 hypothetical protein [Saprospiraceae bacterium]